MGRRFEYRDALPEFPRTPHLPFRATNLDETDVVAPDKNAQIVLSHDIYVDEKVDGANIRVCYYDGNFYVGNRKDILRKGQLPKNPSGLQFKPLWNWLYEHRKSFEKLNTLSPFGPEEPATVYAEWLWMAHGMKYDRLTDYFMAFDVYDSTDSQFLHPTRARFVLEEAGFEMPRRLHEGSITNYGDLEGLLDRRSGYSSDQKQEGLYIKVPVTVKQKVIIHRFKMVRPDFPRGQFFGEEIVRNDLAGAA